MNFQRSVIGGVGFCGIDRKKQPLTGEERRGCWTGAGPVAAGPIFVKHEPASR